MKLRYLVFASLLSGSLATVYPYYSSYQVPVYQPAPIYYTPPVYYPPVNIYTPPIIAAPIPFYVDCSYPYYYSDYYYDYNPSAGKTEAAIGIIGLSLIALLAVINS